MYSYAFFETRMLLIRKYYKFSTYFRVSGANMCISRPL